MHNPKEFNVTRICGGKKLNFIGDIPKDLFDVCNKVQSSWTRAFFLSSALSKYWHDEETFVGNKKLNTCTKLQIANLDITRERLYYIHTWEMQQGFFVANN